MADQYVKLNGFAELEKILEGLSNSTFAKGIVRSGLRRAAKPLIQSASRKIMSYSPTIARTITVNYQSRDGATIGVGPKKKKGQTNVPGEGGSFNQSFHDPWFAHFIEFGVSGIGRFKGRGKIGKGRRASPQQRRRYRADQPARPFMRPAFHETKQEMVDDFEKSVQEAIEKYLKRHAKNVT